MPIVNPYAKRKQSAANPPAAAASAGGGAAQRSDAPNATARPFQANTSVTSTTSQSPPPTAAAAGSNGSGVSAVAGAGNGNSNGISSNGAVAEHHLMMDAQPHLLYVSTRQRGNALLKYVRNVPWAYSQMVPDYVWSATRCALFLSVKYHGLHPNYIRSRIGELGSDFVCRVLLVLVDVQDCANPLLQLNALAVRHSLTLLLAWSDEEAARYLETFKAMDGKDASLIQRQLKSTFCEQAIDVLTECGAVNKTDAGQLLSQFGTLRSLVVASQDELGLVVGMGPVKVQRLHDAFHKPFSTRAAAERKRKAKALERSIEAEEEENAKEAALQSASSKDANKTEFGTDRGEAAQPEEAVAETRNDE
jgi:DNA excision repair protein ERCC-1